MKIAEALLKRKQLRDTMPRVASRIAECAFYVGEVPEDNAEDELKKLVQMSKTYTKLVVDINTTNMINAIEYKGEQISLMQAIARRDSLKATASMLDGIRVRTDAGYDGKRPIVLLSSRAIRNVSNGLAREARELDTLLQQANWTLDLIENE